MKENNEMKYLIRAIFLMLVLILGIILGSGSVFGLTALDGNETFRFPYIDVDPLELIDNNVSFNSTFEDFFCAEAVIVQNVTVQGNVTVLDETLQSGESRQINGEYCQGIVTCQAPPDDPPQSCIVDKTLEPGDHYVLNDGVCDLDIEVDGECEEKPAPVCETFKHRESFRVQTTTTGNLKLEIQNRSFEIPINDLELFSYEGEVELQCPKEVKIDSLAEEDDLLSICQEFTPFLVNDWIRPTLESCRNGIDSQIEDVKACDSEKAGLRDTIASLESSIQAERSEADAIRTVKEEVESDRDFWVAKAEGRQIMLIFSFIWAIVSTIFLALTSLMLFQKNRGGEI